MAIPDIKTAHSHVHRIATMIRLLRAGQPADLLGVVYVLEGNSLGNAAIIPDAARRIQGLPASGCTRYYEGYGSDTARNWQLPSLLDAFPLDQEGCRRVIQVALELFATSEGLFPPCTPSRMGKGLRRDHA